MQTREENTSSSSSSRLNTQFPSKKKRERERERKGENSNDSKHIHKYNSVILFRTRSTLKILYFLFFSLKDTYLLCISLSGKTIFMTKEKNVPI